MNKKIKEKRLYIVFGGEHYNPLGLIRSLGEEGIKPIAIIKKAQFRLASKSKYISKLYLVDTVEEGYQILIKEYNNEKLKPVIFTSDDQITSFLDERCDELKDHFIFNNAKYENGRITKFMNKENINKLAIKHGLKVAKSWNVNIGEIPKDIKYPVVTKAICSTYDNWKKDSIICHNEKELKEAYKKIGNKKVLLQEFINKKNELCLDGYSINKGEKVFYAIASNYINIIENAFSNYMTVKNTYDKEIEDKLSEMFKEIGFEGIFSVEFLIDQNDDLYFLEINFRNSTWSYASTKAGMNLPILWSNAMLNDKVFDKSYQKFEEFKAMVEFVDYNDRVKTGEISKKEWFKQLKECKCLYFWNIHDVKPVLSKLMNALKNKIKRSKCKK